MRDAWRSSPQQADPLSWFSGLQLPLLMSAVSTLDGVILTAVFWDHWSAAGLQLLALPFFLAAGILTALATRPNKRPLGPSVAFAILGVAGVGFVLSAAGGAAEAAHPGLWWASISLAITLGGFAPFSSAKQLLAYAMPAVVLAGVVGAIRYFGRPDQVAGILVVTAPVAVTAVAAIVFTLSTVGRTLRVRGLLATGASDQYSATETERPGNATIARVSAQVTPFLRRITEAGVITETDRTLAAQLARQLRADLVTESNRSWLETVAQESGLIVSDPTGLADRMNESQRAALRGMLLAVMDNPVVDRDSLLIELRAQRDGSTAVAFSLDVDLPEGRRLMLLSPYYLTLKSPVDNLSWADGRSMLFQFQIPAGD